MGSRRGPNSLSKKQNLRHLVGYWQSSRSEFLVKKRSRRGLPRDSNGIPMGFQGIPKGFRGIPKQWIPEGFPHGIPSGSK